MRLLESGLAALLCGACSTTPGITVVATPSPLPGDGVTTATVTATVTEGGSPVDGATVHFTLEVQGGTAAAAWDGASPGTSGKIDVTSSEGTASATMLAPRQGFGSVRFTASFSSQGKEPAASVSVALQPAGGPASAISFGCAHQNIGAFVQGRNTTLHVLCLASALDPAGHAIPNASIQTLSEAGTLSWLQNDQDGTQEFVYAVRPDDPPPLDVMPVGGDGAIEDACPAGCNADPFAAACQGEPCWVDQAGVTHNPRDGIAALVAAVPGVKGFDDQGEPFVDRNDNGVRDPGEPFIDYDGNGKYDPPSGQFQEHMVWKTFRMIWSGEASVTPSGAGTAHDCFMELVSGSAGTYTAIAHFFDRNLNALAADGIASSDGIDWAAGCTPNGSANVLSSATPLNQRDPGIKFNAETGRIDAPGLRSSWTTGTDYQNAVTISGAGAGDTCTVTAGPHRQYDPGAPGFDQTTETSAADVGLIGALPF